MTDQIFYEELRATIRDAIASYLDTYTDEELRELATESLNPPSRPTMADMTKTERAACQWMQCDVEDREGRAVILLPNATGGIAILTDRGGSVIYEDHPYITPRPDLPRLTWPSDKKPAPALPEGWRLADHETYGRVIVTSTTPDADGDVCFVAPVPGIIGNDWHLCDPDELRYLDQ